MARKRIRKKPGQKLDAVEYSALLRQLVARFDDGLVRVVPLDLLKLPEKSIYQVRIDEFRRGVEFHFRDGSMHDVAADYISWLAEPGRALENPEDDELAKRVGETVTRLRDEQGLSQRALAQKADMQPPNLSRLESGKHIPTLDVLLRIAKALGVRLSTLLGEPPRRDVRAYKVSDWKPLRTPPRSTQKPTRPRTLDKRT